MQMHYVKQDDQNKFQYRKYGRNNIYDIFICVKIKNHYHAFSYQNHQLTIQRHGESAKKSGWAYLRVLISNSHHKLKNLRKEPTTLVETLQNIVEDNCLSSLHQAISSRCSHLRHMVAERHQKKFQQLVQKNCSKDIQKKWFINVSKRKLNDNETSLQRKGLNYVCTPTGIPKKEMLASVEHGIKDLPSETKNEVRINIYSILKLAQLPTNRI